MKNAAAFAVALAIMLATSTFAQNARPDDTPKVSIGATIFGDYTYAESPEIKDAGGNLVHLNAFNISRGYINLIGSLNHLVGFRITPDITRESGSGSTLNGSLTFRLKYAFGQLNLDDWTTKGSWLRFGLQQTPWIDFAEGVYRYRFQGPIFADREGFLTSSDFGFSGHYNLPAEYGEIHAGIYNGEGYNHAEPNNEKALQLRGTIRPLPLRGAWNGLRLTVFVDDDHPQQGLKKRRILGQVSFESSWVSAAAEILSAKDQSSAVNPTADAGGYSVWATPKLGRGWELLLRHDQLKPNKMFSDQKHTQNIAGLAYWFPHMQRATSALMIDYDAYRQPGFAPARPNQTNYGVNVLINF